MWNSFLLKVINMSMTASIVILFVLLARLLLKRTPKLYSYALWAVVLFRLLCPVTLNSDLSLFGLIDAPVSVSGTLEYIPASISSATAPTIAASVPEISSALPEDFQEETPPIVNSSMTPQVIAGALWLLGIIALLVYSTVALLRLHRRLIGAVPLQDNIYLADHITTPFLIGLFRPRIYLPSSLTDREQEYILMHERYHLRRFDHVVKLLAFAALCLHWFNPLVWLAFVLSSKDMEMSCDEAVLKNMGEEIRHDYSVSLLTLATGRRMITGTLLAFGEGNTKARIKNAISWKKPTIRITLLAAVLCVAVTISCAANPKLNSLAGAELFGRSYRVRDVMYNAPQYSFTYSVETAPKYSLTTDHQLMVKGEILQESQGNDWQLLGVMSEVTLTEDNFDRCFMEIDGVSGWREEKTADEIRLENQNAWRLIVGDDQNQVFYYVLQQKDGELFLTYGYHAPESESSPSINTSEGESASDQEAPLIRWLFQLTPMDGSSSNSVVSDSSPTDKTVPANPSTGEVAQRSSLEIALTNAILDFNKNQSIEGDISCESHVILSTEFSSPKIEGQPDTVTVYAMVLYQTFDYTEEGLQDISGSHIPTALTFEVGEGGEYTLTEYWQPRDGSYYTKDIREKFPKSIQEDALDTQKYILSQIQACYAKVVGYGKVDTTKVIERLFQVILSSPAASSNPSSYIDAHPIEYRELTYYGDNTLLYIFSEFRKGGQTGLKGHLMWSVMDTLIGSEAINQTASNGQEYFDAWAKEAERMEETYGLDYMKANAPKAYLFLQSMKH